MKKIILISPFPPAQNPRLLKEYLILKELGFIVIVIYGSRDYWASSFDSSNQDFVLIGGKKGDISYFFTRLFFKFLIKPFSKVFSINAISYFQYLKIKSIKADLYIAHNLAALPIAVKAAKFHKAKCGFDAEDFHRQEVSDNINSKEYQLAKYIEDKYLPQLDYLTAASPLIAAEYKKLYPSLNPVVINNVFSRALIPPSGVGELPPSGARGLSYSQDLGVSPHNSPFSILDSPLKLFWFSQTIGKGRGLEDVIAAMQLLKNVNLELHLLGNVSSATKLYFQNLAKEIQIFYYEPIAPEAIFEFASRFDIGLALEQNIPYNRDICLTNKIFTYLTSGLAIIASETSAQKQFMQTHPTVGQSYEIGNIETLACIIKYYFENKEALLKAQKASIELAQTDLNWEVEGKKFLEIINQL